MTNKINIIAGLYECRAFEQVTVNDTAQTLSESSYRNGDDYAKRAIITIESGQISWRYDGATPTSSTGHASNPFDTIVLIGSENMRNFRAIRKTSTNATISVSYEF